MPATTTKTRKPSTGKAAAAKKKAPGRVAGGKKAAARTKRAQAGADRIRKADTARSASKPKAKAAAPTTRTAGEQKVLDREQRIKAALVRAGLAPTGEYSKAELDRAAKAGDRESGDALRNRIMGKAKAPGKTARSITDADSKAAERATAIANSKGVFKSPILAGDVARMRPLLDGKTPADAVGLTKAALKKWATGEATPAKGDREAFAALVAKANTPRIWGRKLAAILTALGEES